MGEYARRAYEIRDAHAQLVADETTRRRPKSRIGRTILFLVLLAGVAVALFVGIARAESKPPLSNAQALSLLSALRVLDGRSVVVKQATGETVVPTPWDFGSGVLRLRIARNITALAAVEQLMETTRVEILKEILRKMPPTKEGQAQTSVFQGTPEWDNLQRQYGEALNLPASVDLSRIRASELRLDRNDIPGTALSALAPILDDDVTPK